MATVQTLDKIRESLERHLGKKILLKANKGRKQIVTKKGILEKVYPSVFVVKLDSDNEGCSRVSYSYSDLLTSNVKLQVFRNQDKLYLSKIGVIFFLFIKYKYSVIFIFNIWGGQYGINKRYNKSRQ